MAERRAATGHDSATGGEKSQPFRVVDGESQLPRNDQPAWFTVPTRQMPGALHWRLQRSDGVDIVGTGETVQMPSTPGNHLLTVVTRW